MIDMHLGSRRSRLSIPPDNGITDFVMLLYQLLIAQIILDILKAIAIHLIRQAVQNLQKAPVFGCL